MFIFVLFFLSLTLGLVDEGEFLTLFKLIKRGEVTGLGKKRGRFGFGSKVKKQAASFRVSLLREGSIRDLNQASGGAVIHDESDTIPLPTPAKSEEELLGEVHAEFAAKLDACGGSSGGLDQPAFKALVRKLLKLQGMASDDTAASNTSKSKGTTSSAVGMPSDQDLEAAFVLADTDKSGRVDASEFVALFKLVRQGHVAGLAAPKPRALSSTSSFSMSPFGATKRVPSAKAKAFQQSFRESSAAAQEDLPPKPQPIAPPAGAVSESDAEVTTAATAAAAAAAPPPVRRSYSFSKRSFSFSRKSSEGVGEASPPEPPQPQLPPLLSDEIEAIVRRVRRAAVQGGGRAESGLGAPAFSKLVLELLQEQAKVPQVAAAPASGSATSGNNGSLLDSENTLGTATTPATTATGQETPAVPLPNTADLDAAFTLADEDLSGLVDEHEFIKLYQLIRRGEIVGLGTASKRPSFFSRNNNKLKREASFRKSLNEAEPAPSLPCLTDRYLVGAEVGRGEQFAVVHRATVAPSALALQATTSSSSSSRSKESPTSSNESEFAVKIVPKAPLNSAELSAAKEELTLAKRAGGSHLPGVVKFVAAFDDPGSFALVTELIEGGSLADRIGAREKHDSENDNHTNDSSSNTTSRLSEDDAKAVVRGLLEALKGLHGKSLAHRHVTPANVLLRASSSTSSTSDGKGSSSGSALNPGQVVLCDLGHVAPFVGRNLQGNPNKSGSDPAPDPNDAAYAPPEFFGPGKGGKSGKGTVLYDGRCDVWSAGVIAYEMLTGRKPFNSADSADATLSASRRAPNYGLPADAFQGYPWNDEDDESHSGSASGGVSTWAAKCIARMLTVDVSKRPTPGKLLQQDPWFTGIYPPPRAEVERDSATRLQQLARSRFAAKEVSHRRAIANAPRPPRAPTPERSSGPGWEARQRLQMGCGLAAAANRTARLDAQNAINDALALMADPCVAYPELQPYVRHENGDESKATSDDINDNAGAVSTTSAAAADAHHPHYTTPRYSYAYSMPGPNTADALGPGGAPRGGNAQRKPPPRLGSRAPEAAAIAASVLKAEAEAARKLGEEAVAAFAVAAAAAAARAEKRRARRTRGGGDDGEGSASDGASDDEGAAGSSGEEEEGGDSSSGYPRFRPRPEVLAAFDAAAAYFTLLPPSNQESDDKGAIEAAISEDESGVFSGTWPTW